MYIIFFRHPVLVFPIPVDHLGAHYIGATNGSAKHGSIREDLDEIRYLLPITSAARLMELQRDVLSAVFALWVSTRSSLVWDPSRMISVKAAGTKRRKRQFIYWEHARHYVKGGRDLTMPTILIL